MKTTLPSALLLLLNTLTTATPVPSRSSGSSTAPVDCALTSCDPELTSLINKPPSTDRKTSSTTSISHHSTQKFDHLKITISIAEESEESFSNTPAHPSIHTAPSEALTAKNPLSSSYLQSLGQQSPEVKDLEDKVSSYLASHPSSSTRHSSTDNHPVGKKPCKPQHIYLPGNVYITTHHYVSRNPDIAVIGIVLVFLLGILVVECAEHVGGVLRRRRASKGQIFLAADKRKAEMAFYGDETDVALLSDVEKAAKEDDWEVLSSSERDAADVKL